MVSSDRHILERNDHEALPVEVGNNLCAIITLPKKVNKLLAVVDEYFREVYSKQKGVSDLHPHFILSWQVIISLLYDNYNYLLNNYIFFFFI